MVNLSQELGNYSAASIPFDPFHAFVTILRDAQVVFRRYLIPRGSKK